MITKTLLTAAASVLAVTTSFAQDNGQPKMTPEMEAKIREALAKGGVPQPKLPAMSLEEAKQYFSYNIGVNIGSQLKTDKMMLSEEVLKGLKKALAGEATAKDIDPAKMQQAQSIIQEAQVAVFKKEGTDFLAANKKKEGVVVTKSGLQYKVVKEGKGETPTPADQVKVHYTGKLIDGTVFDSSVKRGKPTTFPVTAVIPGWVEGLQLMKPGSKYEFVIPQELAYGARGAGQNIPGFATLVFEVELLEVIKPAKPAPAAPKEAPKKK